MTAFNPLHPVPCVYFKHGAYWLVKRGKWERIGKTLEEALAEYGRRAQQSQAGKLPALIETTLHHHFKAAKLAPSTKAQYRLAAEVLKRKFKPFDDPGQIKGRHVAKLKADGAEHPNMTNRQISLLRTLCGYWVEWQLCDANPCIGVTPYKEPKRKRLIEPAEWLAIHNKAGSRLRAIMTVALLTGQRIGDVLTIRRNQLTADGIQFAQQKTDKALTVRWSVDLREAVETALALHRGVPALTLFVGRNGKSPNYRTVALQWEKACAAAGVSDARLNDQRAQSLTSTRRQGKDATALAGHSSASMTERYLRDREVPQVDGPDLRQALDVGQKRT